MQNDDRLDAAVAAGAIDADAAERLRRFQANDGAAPAADVDEENIRLVTSFNDIFVSIAIILVLVAAGTMGGAVVVAAACWGLAEFFTRKRRMALPSVILAVMFSISVFAFVARLFGTSITGLGHNGMAAVAGATILAAVGVITAAATSGYWMRFKAPVSIACATVAVAAAALGVLMVVIGSVASATVAISSLSWLSFATGIAIFAFAMRWDMSDLTRTTRRSDVAFWLHLAASPLIVHPIFLNLGMLGRDGNATGAALVAVLVYLLLGLVAVVVDRRAILVSALVYVLTAMGVLLRTSEPGAMTFALPAAVIGGLLLLLSAFWQPLRRSVVSLLPDEARRRLPILG